ncbi:MAG: hypothetical protein ABI740_03140 [Alphaproteobacteria bacterium]
MNWGRALFLVWIVFAALVWGLGGVIIWMNTNPTDPGWPLLAGSVFVAPFAVAGIFWICTGLTERVARMARGRGSRRDG